MSDPVLACRDERRRDDVRARPLFGLDFVEVSPDQRTLTVVFLGKAPPRVEKENVRIRGGRRITHIVVTALRRSFSKISWRTFRIPPYAPSFWKFENPTFPPSRSTRNSVYKSPVAAPTTIAILMNLRS